MPIAAPFPLRSLSRPAHQAATLPLMLAFGALGAFSGPSTAAPVAQAERAERVERVESAPAPSAPLTKPEAQTVEINGTRHVTNGTTRRARLGVLGRTDALDAPFSVTTRSDQALRDRHATTVAEAVADDPSVRSAAAPGGLFDTLFIRGFPVSEGNLGEFGFDGVYGIAPNYRVMTEYAERVELVKGPTALLYGMSPNGGIGGSINLVPKRAGDADLTRLGLDLASRSQAGARIDLGRRFGADRAFGVRVNASLRDGDTALDHQARRAQVGAIALDWRGQGARATLDLIGQHERLDAPSRPYFLAAGLATVPDAPPGRRNVSQAWEWSEVDDRAALLRGELDLGERVTAFAHAGASRNEVDRLFSNLTITNAGGEVRAQPQRFRFDIRRSTAEAGLRAQLDSGGVQQTLTLQATQYRDRLARGSINGSALVSNLYAPVTHTAQAVAAPATVPRLSETTLSGIALADTIALARGSVLLTLGARVQQVETDNFSAATGVPSGPRYDRRATTPMLGLVLKPRQGLSLYANLIEGLSRGDVIPATASNAAEGVLAPYRARQIEMGAKLEHEGASASASLFQIDKPSGQFSSGTSGAYTADAEQRNRGLELAASGPLRPGLRVTAALSLIDAELTRSSTPARIGKTPVGVPRHQAQLGTEWDTGWLPGLTLHGAVLHAGAQYVDVANTQRIPAWHRVDAGARYTVNVSGRPTTWRLTVQNLLDRDHWAGVASYGGLAQGLPRTLALSASVDL
jgi:iron complex outermembrane receptor protein